MWNSWAISAKMGNWVLFWFAAHVFYFLSESQRLCHYIVKVILQISFKITQLNMFSRWTQRRKRFIHSFIHSQVMELWVWSWKSTALFSFLQALRESMNHVSWIAEFTCWVMHKHSWQCLYSDIKVNGEPPASERALLEELTVWLKWIKEMPPASK